MDPVEISISAATQEERQRAVDLVASAANEVGADASLPVSPMQARRKAIEVGDVVTVLVGVASSIGTGIVGNAIYDKLKAVRADAGRVTQRTTQTEMEIVDEKSGTRIVLRTKTSEKSSL